MSRRVRALFFFGLAAIAGLTGAVMIDGYRDQALAELGEMRPVVVTTGPLPASQTVTPAMAGRRLTTVRVPERFAPADPIPDPSVLIGLTPVTTLPAGIFISTTLLRRPAREPMPGGSGLGDDRRPVEIRVTGVAALEVGPRPSLVDVVVTSDPAAGGVPRTYVSAAAVPLIELVRTTEATEPGAARAVLGLTRKQALRLIRAESFARGIRLLAHPGSA